MSDPVFERYKDALKQGHVAVLRGRPKEALARYDEAAKLADHRALPHLSMGSVLLEIGRPKDALQAYDHAIERAPVDPAGYKGRAAALRALGRHAEAEAVDQSLAREQAAIADQRAREDEEHRTAAFGRGVESLVSEADEAIVAGQIDTAVEKLVSAADGYLATGAIDAALDACQRAVTVRPASTSVHLLMVRAYLARDHRERAIERLVLLDRLLWLEPDPSASLAVAALCNQGRDLDPRLAEIADAGARAAG